MRRNVLALSLLGLTLAAAAPRAHAAKDAVQLFRNIDVTPDTPVEDAVCFFCSVHVEGRVEGDIVSFFGAVHLNGEARHDVVSIFGKVTVADNSTIGDDIVSLFGSVRLGDNVKVGKDLVAVFGTVRAAQSASVGEDRVSISPMIFWGPLLLLVLVVYLIVHEVRVRRFRQFAQGYPIPPPRP